MVLGPSPPPLALMLQTLPKMKETANCGHCNTLQRSTSHYNILQHTATPSTRCNSLHRTASHCNTLQHSANYDTVDTAKDYFFLKQAFAGTFTTHLFLGNRHFFLAEMCMFGMGWLRFVGSLELYVSFANEPYKRDDILQKRPIILSILLTISTPPHIHNICCTSTS